jgi:multicomponent Na+:H+ antiporter subunit G
MIGEALVLAGSVLILVSALGVVRFGDVLTRMHALTKASTVGVVLALLGAALALNHPNDVTSVALALGLQVLTAPVSANLLARATYRARGIANRLDEAPSPVADAPNEIRPAAPGADGPAAGA